MTILTMILKVKNKMRSPHLFRGTAKNRIKSDEGL